VFDGGVCVVVVCMWWWCVCVCGVYVVVVCVCVWCVCVCGVCETNFGVGSGGDLPITKHDQTSLNQI
jgi:hypothetical protein